MTDRLRAYIDELFVDAPNIKRTVELKEEILQNITDKYNDMLAEGKTEEAAYNIAVASIGDVSVLIEELNRRYSEAEALRPDPKQKLRSAILVSVAVFLYIVSIVPIFIFEPNGNEMIGLVLMFVLVALATGLLIFNSMTKVKYNKIDDTVVEEFREWQESNKKKSPAFNAINSALWTLTVTVYIIVSFWTGAWHITWIIFLISSAITGIIKAAFDISYEAKRKNRTGG